MNNLSRRVVAIAMWLVLVAGAMFVPGAQEAQAQTGSDLDFKQCANGTTSVHNCDWLNGIVQQSNSTYVEGMGDMQRVLIKNLSPGAHTLLFSHQTTKGGIHAFDWLISYDQAIRIAAQDELPYAQATQPVDPGPWFLNDTGACGTVPGGFGTACADLNLGGNFIDIEVPDDLYVDTTEGPYKARTDAFETRWGNRTIRIWGDQPFAAGSLSIVSHSGSDIGDSDINYSLSWQSNSTVIMIQFAGHIAQSNNREGYGWGVGQGSASISGGPYHISLSSIDGASTGSQDNQLKGADILLPGSITIVKNTDPDATQDFPYTTTGGLNPSIFTLDDDGLEGGDLACSIDDNCVNTKVYDPVLGDDSGGKVYTITEDLASIPGYRISGISCTQSQDGVTTSVITYTGATTGATTGFEDGDNTARIVLHEGSFVNCVFTNVPRTGKVRISKQVLGGGSSSDWSMHVTGSDGSSEVAGSPQNGVAPPSYTEYTLNVGTYKAFETGAPNGYSLIDVNCTESGGTADTTDDGAMATINLQTNEIVHCTFTNSKDATVTITKDAEPDDAQDFSFTATGTGPSGWDSFVLDDDGTLTTPSSTPNSLTFTFSGLPEAGRALTVTEGTNPSGWTFTSLSCSATGAGTTKNENGKTAEITLTPGGSVSCTYKNTKDATVTITKDAQPNDAQDFSFTTTGTGPAGWGSFPLDDDSDNTLPNSRTFAFSGLPTAGRALTVTEGDNPDGWTFTNLSCSATGTGTTKNENGKTAEITLTPGGSVTCTYTNNKPDANITINPLNPVNEVDDPETFTVTVTQIPHGAQLATTGTLTYSVTPAPSSAITGTCGASPATINFSGDTATCTIIINNNAADIFAIHAEVDVSIGSVALHRETGDGLPGDSADAQKTYVDASIALSPLNATNVVGDPHTITAHVTKNDGTGVTDASGVTVNFTNTGLATFVGDDFCTTNSSGVCSIQITSSSIGSNTINATTTFSVLGLSLTRQTSGGDAGPDGTGPAHKSYVDANITIAESATNSVGDPHTFTITVTQFPNGATPATQTTITPSVSPTPDVSSNTCGTVDFDSNTNTATCTLTINNNTPGVFTANASANLTIGGLNITRSTAGNSGSGGSGPATKTYVAGTIIIRKATVPAGGSGFGFTATGDLTPLTFNLNDGGSRTYSNLPLGSYSVSENNPALLGFDLSGIDCSATTGTGTSATANGQGGVNIVLAAGGIADCTFTNTQRSSLFLRKIVDVGLSAATPEPKTSWTLSGNGPSPCSGAGDTDCVGILNGAYTLSEAGNVPGYTNGTVWSCQGGSFNAQTNVITVPAGGSATCSITNTLDPVQMPINKLIAGRDISCVESNVQETDLGNGVTQTDKHLFCTDGPNLAGSVIGSLEMDCTWSHGGPDDTAFPVPPGRIVSCTNQVAHYLPQFNSNLYPQDPSGQPLSFFDGSCTNEAACLGRAFLPPENDPFLPPGLPATICEVGIPGGWHLPEGGVTLTPFTGAPPVAGTPIATDVYIPAGAGLQTVVLNAGGTGYTAGDNVIVDGGTGGTVQVTAVDGAGAVTAFIVILPGHSYSAGTGVATTGGTGTGFTVDIQEVYAAGDDRTRCFNFTLPVGSTRFEIDINNIPVGKIVVQKESLGGLGEFGFTPTGGGDCNANVEGVDLCTDGGFSGNFSLDTNDSNPIETDPDYFVEARLANATLYGVSETSAPGSLDDWIRAASCSGDIQGPLAGNTSFGVAPGETVTCSFTNTAKGRIQVVKTTIGGDDTFSFSSNFGLPNISTSGGTGSETVGALIPGSAFSLSENNKSGWRITTPLSCDHGSTLPGGIVVVSGETTVCTITNTKEASLRLVKDCNPGTAENTGFEFNVDGNPLTMACGESRTIVPPTIDEGLGEHTFEEIIATLPATWFFDHVTCRGDDDFSAEGPIATVDLESGENIVCTYYNEAPPTQRFTGGGSFYPNLTDTNPDFPNTPKNDHVFSDVRITHGFILHCNDKIVPNRLEVNWAGKGKGRNSENNFHLQSPGDGLLNAQCIDDSNIDEQQPDANVDTYEGWGTGSFNNTPGYFAHWVFTDAGEPGKDDEVWMIIFDPNGAEILRVGGAWDQGIGFNVGILLTPAQLEALVLGPTGPQNRQGTDGANITVGNQQAHK